MLGNLLTGKKKAELSADDIIGIAVGQMGLALEDFLRLTPSEYNKAYESWLRHNEMREKQEWERARWMVFKAMTPPKKQQITVYDLIKFPWEGSAEDDERSSVDRFEELKRKWQ